jgi:hypothetical protein
MDVTYALASMDVTVIWIYLYIQCVPNEDVNVIWIHLFIQCVPMDVTYALASAHLG